MRGGPRSACAEFPAGAADPVAVARGDLMSVTLSKRSCWFISANARRLATRLAAASLATAFMAGCATARRTPEMHTSVRVEPTVGTTPASPIAPSALPDLPPLPAEVSGPALASAPQRRLLEVNIPEGTPIATAVAQIAREYGLSVVVDPDVRGTTQAHLINVSLTEALDHIIPRSRARYLLEGGVLRVAAVRMESRTFTLDYVAISRVGTMSTVVHRRLSNAAEPLPGGSDVLTAQPISDVWSDIRVALTGILRAGQPSPAVPAQDAAQRSAVVAPGPQASSTSFGDGSALIISPSAGLITVTAMPEKIASVERYIADFQASVLRQVMISAKIVEVRLDKAARFGIDWSSVTASASTRSGVQLRSDSTAVTTGDARNINFIFAGGTTTVDALLAALESQGDIHVLSNEQTTALNNQRAIFQVTSDEVFFGVNRSPLLGPNGDVVSRQSSVIPQQVSVGVVLDVLPQISADNILTMDIRPAVTNVTSVATVSLADGTSVSAPTIARREGDTTARLRAGETMMIGGLIQSRSEKRVTGIPLLKDIPFIGRAFRKTDNVESRSELVVFLTPTIITGQSVVGR
jgi:MSHA biogenesis protein MshL